ncbi:MAG: hypothetical protein ACTSVA_06500 [Candidatus Njordarchaeales archaeon]
MGILERLFVKVSKERYKKEIEDIVTFLDEEIKRLKEFKKKLIIPENKDEINAIITGLEFLKEQYEREKKDLFIGRLLGIID